VTSASAVLSVQPVLCRRVLKVLILRINGLLVDRLVLLGAEILELVVKSISHPSTAKGLDIERGSDERITRGSASLGSHDVAPRSNDHRLPTRQIFDAPVVAVLG